MFMKFYIWVSSISFHVLVMLLSCVWHCPFLEKLKCLIMNKSHFKVLKPLSTSSQGIIIWKLFICSLNQTEKPTERSSLSVKKISRWISVVISRVFLPVLKAYIESKSKIWNNKSVNSQQDIRPTLNLLLSDDWTRNTNPERASSSVILTE